VRQHKAKNPELNPKSMYYNISAYSNHTTDETLISGDIYRAVNNSHQYTCWQHVNPHVNTGGSMLTRAYRYIRTYINEYVRIGNVYD
jgi:hypothetical protein